MWDYLQAKRILELYGQPLDLMNSPFAFPRLPVNAKSPIGISNASKIKDTIVNDKDLMLSRLSDYHEMFQRYAANMFDLLPPRFVPGHPMHMKISSSNSLRKENDRLKKENTRFKTDLDRKK